VEQIFNVKIFDGQNLQAGSTTRIALNNAHASIMVLRVAWNTPGGPLHSTFFRILEVFLEGTWMMAATMFAIFNADGTGKAVLFCPKHEDEPEPQFAAIERELTAQMRQSANPAPVMHFVPAIGPAGV